MALPGGSLFAIAGTSSAKTTARPLHMMDIGISVARINENLQVQVPVNVANPAEISVEI